VKIRPTSIKSFGRYVKIGTIKGKGAPRFETPCDPKAREKKSMGIKRITSSALLLTSIMRCGKRFFESASEILTSIQAF